MLVFFVLMIFILGYGLSESSKNNVFLLVKLMWEFKSVAVQNVIL